MTPILKVEGVTFLYSQGTPFERCALREAVFDVCPGEIVGLIGRTGSGKSTLVQHLNGLLKPATGHVLFEGQDIWRSKAATRSVRFSVGLVFQYPEHQLFEETVFADVAFGPRNMGLSEGEVRDRVLAALNFVGLPEEIGGVSPFELSGGQKRRAAIAGVISMKPKVLILDEPTAGLDPVGCTEILSHVIGYHEKENAAVVFVSHSMEEIAKLADRIVVMDGGQIALGGAPADVFADPERLERLGLDIPQVAKLACALRGRGVPLNGVVYTLEQAEAAVLEALAC